jgi:hypothetical protein
VYYQNKKHEQFIDELLAHSISKAEELNEDEQ